MSTHAVPAGTHPAPGQCSWEHYSHGVLLDCDQDAIPGGVECCEHLIERVHSMPGDPFADEPVRSFDARVVSLGEVTAQ